MNKFGYRQGIISGIIVTVCVVYLLRLFTYQVVSDKYKIMAENNSQRTETEYPARGLIYDRNNKLLVDNQAAYDLMVIPNQVKACLLYTSPSPRDKRQSRMPSSA